jgi:hypothetical protein
LAEQLAQPAEFNTHDLSLAYMEERGPATVDELLVYLWQVTHKVTSREYMYHVLKRLRDRGLIERVELESETVVRHMLTTAGEKHIEAKGIGYVKPEVPSE